MKKNLISIIVIILLVSSLGLNYHFFNETSSLKNMIGLKYRLNHEEVMWNFEVEVFDHVLKQLRQGDEVQFARYYVKVSSLVASHRLGNVDNFYMMLLPPLNEISINYAEDDMDALEKNADIYRERLILTNDVLAKLEETLGEASNKEWYNQLSNINSELNSYISERWSQAF
ncbi:hypothetical protein BKP35_12395 [Anaerobacillus arseniciselenatis]|uniref:Uncharacterized protein n=1 Tax=Anaerobacillus arseniciselenatis TaxID=85682 RepID=A0A1S2LFX5_9BACI|nr:hypothetical protein [Anaerobacillus arseniciselenatis]OIJ11291.1 hypothetical protein BKP35_12395 [Anaerobacillus arseniciselenatis]